MEIRCRSGIPDQTLFNWLKPVEKRRLEDKFQSVGRAQAPAHGERRAEDGLRDPAQSGVTPVHLDYPARRLVPEGVPQHNPPTWTFSRAA